MSVRRDGGGGGFNPDKLAERLEARDDALRSRIEALFDGAEERLKRIEHAVAVGGQERHRLANEIAEVRRDLGEGRATTALLREELARHVQATTEVTAVAGAAVIEAKGTAATLLDRIASSTKLQRGTAAAVAVGGLLMLADLGPGVVRLLNAWGASVATFWTGLGK